MFKLPYLIIKQRLDDLQGLKWITWDLGQDRDDAQGELRTAPAAFIRFSPVQTSSQGRGIQETVLQFDIRLVTVAHQTDDKRIHDRNQMDHFDLVDDIYNRLTGFRANIGDVKNFFGLQWVDQKSLLMGTIDRVSVEPEHNFTRLMRTTQTFQGRFFDYTGNPEYKQVVKGLTIENFEIML